MSFRDNHYIGEAIEVRFGQQASLMQSQDEAGEDGVLDSGGTHAADILGERRGHFEFARSCRKTETIESPQYRESDEGDHGQLSGEPHRMPKSNAQSFPGLPRGSR